MIEWSFSPHSYINHTHWNSFWCLTKSLSYNILFSRISAWNGTTRALTLFLAFNWIHFCRRSDLNGEGKRVSKTVLSQSLLLNHYIFKMYNVQSLDETNSPWTPLFTWVLGRSCWVLWLWPHYETLIVKYTLWIKRNVLLNINRKHVYHFTYLSCN